jgi:hypothetical protein
METYQRKGVSTRKLPQWSQGSASTYYYKASGDRKGVKPSTHSVNENGELFENKVVVSDIERVLN